MQQNSATQRKVDAGFAVALACLVLIGIASHFSAKSLSESASWVDHTHEVLRRLENLLSALTNAETAQRGYIITGDESYLEPYRSSLRMVAENQSHLAALTADNAIQQ